MLFSIDGGAEKQVTRIPHEREYRGWRARLSDPDFEAVRHALKEKLDTQEIHTSSWIPGTDWTGTVYQPLYEACRRDVTAAARFFGIILWQVVMEDEDHDWSFGRYEKDGVPIEGMTYFRINRV